MKKALFAGVLALVTGSAWAAPVKYDVDPNHTHPSFATDHFGGLSVWRGLLDVSSGTIELDKEKGSGNVEITVDMSTVDFGHPKLSEHVKSAEMFDVQKYPTATYKGKLTNFKNGAPTEVQGELTMHGVTRPVNLTIDQFKCMINPMSKKEVCGADAKGTLNRAEFGVNYGEKMGFKQEVKLAIQVEAIKAG